MKPLFWSNPAAGEQVKEVLKKGEIVLAAGDTILGLLANISQSGYDHLDNAKNRSNKPYLLLVENKQKALMLLEKNIGKVFQAEKLMNICWPGPVTLICKAKSDIPLGVKSPEGNVAIRVPDHAGLLELLHHFDALYSTSANLTGEPVPTTLEDVHANIMKSVSCIVLNDNQSESVVPSTIIDCTGDRPKVVRQGAFPAEKLVDFLE